MVVFDDDSVLAHYGILRRSGRYPWGSGGNSELSEAKDFRSALTALKKDGITQAQIAKAFDLTTAELRANIAISDAIVKQDMINRAENLKRQGDGYSAIGKKMGINESTVRGLLKPDVNRKFEQLVAICETIKTRIAESFGIIDVSKGTEHHLGITKNKLDTAIAMLQSEGYTVESIRQPNATTTNDTRVRVVAKPGMTRSDINKNKSLIEGIHAFSDDGGKSFTLAQEPLHLSPSRLQVVYGSEGGENADGTIYVRPGVNDLSMGAASYAQVRIQVGEGHFIKGMAIYKEGLPAGVDVQFHTTKENKGDKLKALKEVKEGGEPIERFGAVYRQITDPKTGKVASHLNIVNDEENWEKWSKTLATQMLSKQKPDFVKNQLEVTYAEKKAQYDEIMQLTNPVVKKELLKDFADNMDAASVHMKAAALPRQKTQVILPVNSLKDNEVYAPNFKDGERVVLIRYPHGGKFEIPELVVTNSNREAKALLNPALTRSAIGINANVAKRLSGADFDGDTVVVIPNNSRRIKNEPALAALKDFDPQEAYRGSTDGGKTMLPGVKKMTNTQTEMGKITNLINDMTLLGADHSELARAVKHSMVVIDAEKHGLDYRRSAEENGIKALQKRYQPGKHGGASTIISRIKREQEVLDYKLRPKSEGGGIDPKTGEPIYVPTGKTTSRKVVDADGNETWVQVPKTVKVPLGSRVPGVTIRDPETGLPVPVRDATDLLSGPASQPKSTRGTLVERHYAEYSNKVRSLANQARLSESKIADPKVNLSAKKAYEKEVASLNAKLKYVQSRSPLERQAQRAAATIVRMKREETPDMTKEQLKRAKGNAIRLARERVGAKPLDVTFTDREWEAIQNGAVASNTLRELLTKANSDHVRQRAQPKTKLLMQPHNISLAKSLMANGYSRAEIAAKLGVSVSTLDRSLYGTG